jgi:hypothetical protein
MNLAYLNSSETSFFSDAQKQLDFVILQLSSQHNKTKEHGEIEQFINTEGNEILRCLLQGYLDLRSHNEQKLPFVISNSGEKLNHVREKCTCNITSLFGDVIAKRKGYTQRKKISQYPLDEELNLPNDQYSEGMRHRVIYEVIKCSYDECVDAIQRTTGGAVPKRQSMNIVKEIAEDFVPFYEQNARLTQEETTDILALSFDGKGIVMRPDGLRDCTKKAAEKSKKLNSRLSPGEKKDRKRMAEVATVYTTKAHIRTAETIMKHEENVHPIRVPPRNKRVWASVERECEDVIEEAFKEACQRDPEHQREWVVLVDGLPHQLKLIDRVMKRLDVKATIVMDFIHVLEYLWKAAWCLFEKGDNLVEEWIEERAIKILNGKCNQVAKGIKISATRRKLEKREGIDKCAQYLLKNKKRLQYDKALKAGFPIASGVIEGACRHLINDRLDITGARWGLDGAEALLKLRSLKSSGDLEKYLDFHRIKAKQRNYKTKN